METGPGIGGGDYVIGSGVEIQSIRRAHDELVEKKLNNSITSHNEKHKPTHTYTTI